MPISIHSFTLRPRAVAIRAPFMLALLALACTRSNDTASDSGAIPREGGPTTLVIELPAGVEVDIDGQEGRNLPVAPIEVEPGKHTITLTTACQQIEIEVDAVAHETTRVDRTLASELGSRRLRSRREI